MDLSGTWRASPADDDLRRTAFEMDFDDSSWEAITVPGHWRGDSAFNDSDGPLIYRTRFETAPVDTSVRTWVVFDGLFYQGDVWLDGAYVGDPEGYFFPHEYEITDLARLSSEHCLAVEVTCTPPADRKAKRAITGVFQHWDCIDPSWNPGGIWRPVRLEETGPVRITRLRVVCREADAERAVMLITATIDSDRSRTVRMRTTAGDIVERETEHRLAAGVNEVEWGFGIDSPSLWWPWMLGPQPLTSIAVEVFAGGVSSHRRQVTTGLRQVAMRNWMMSVNGEQLFLKGANLGPTRAALADASPDELRRDVLLAKDAGLDLIRIHGHITRPELYEAADELGMLIWQDFPLQWGYARSIRRQAVHQVAKAVDLLGHHPSVALWCGHNEPIRLDMAPGWSLDDRRVKASFVAGQELPSWNRSVLDRWVKRAFENADESRPVVAHSGVAPHLPALDGTDSHLYFGWYHGDERDLPGFAATIARMVRFVSEFGAQAVPNTADFMEPERWPDLDWDRLEREHCLQRHVFDRHVAPGGFATFDAWRLATQWYQADLLKHHIETLRRLKYRPTGGFAMFSLADSAPGVTWSVLGHDRSAKIGYQAVSEACRPVIVVAERPPPTVAPGATIALDVHVVSDLRHPLGGVEVTAHLHWPGGSHGWRWQGDVSADECVRVGTLSFVVPDVLGEARLDLSLVGPEVTASNRYLVAIRH